MNSRTKKLISVFFFCGVFFALALSYFSKKENPINGSGEVELETVVRDLDRLLLSSFDVRGRKVVGLSCSLNENDCSSPTEEGGNRWNIASVTWLINFYSAKSGSHFFTDEEREQSASRARELSLDFMSRYSNAWNMQAQIFADAFKRGGDPIFLRAYFFSVPSVIFSFLDGRFDDLKLIHSEPLMRLVAFSLQPLQTSAFLAPAHSDDLKDLKFDKLDSTIKFNRLLASYSNSNIDFKSINSKIRSEVSRRILNSNGVNLAPLRAQSPESFNQDVCWAIYADAKASEILSDSNFSKEAISLLQSTNLLKGDLSGVSTNTLQSFLPCLESLKILKSSHQEAKIPFDLFLGSLLDRFLDSSIRPLCSGRGGMLARGFSNPNSDYRFECDGNLLSLADNSWLFSIMANMENRKLQIMNSAILEGTRNG